MTKVDDDVCMRTIAFVFSPFMLLLPFPHFLLTAVGFFIVGGLFFVGGVKSLSAFGLLLVFSKNFSENFLANRWQYLSVPPATTVIDLRLLKGK